MYKSNRNADKYMHVIIRINDFNISGSLIQLHIHTKLYEIVMSTLQCVFFIYEVESDNRRYEVT